MVWEFIKLTHPYEETTARLWVADYAKNNEEYFALYYNGILWDYYTLLEHAVEGLELQVANALKEGWTR